MVMVAERLESYNKRTHGTVEITVERDYEKGRKQREDKANKQKHLFGRSLHLLLQFTL